MVNKNEKHMVEWKKQWMIVLPTEAIEEYRIHPIIKRLYLTDIGFFPVAGNHYRERKEGIEEYIYFYCVAGKGVIEIQGKQLILKANEAVCIPRLEAHKYYSDDKDPWSILWVHFKGTDTKEYPLEELKIVCFQDQYTANRMLFLFESLFHALKGNYTKGNFIYITQVLSMILAETYQIEQNKVTEKQDRLITNMIQYMYQHLQERMEVSSLCEEFAISKSQLYTIFQEYTKQAPMDFFTKLKMKEACKRMKTTNGYVYEIARELGYNDPFYFSRQFKKIVGVSPKEYQTGNYFYS